MQARPPRVRGRPVQPRLRRRGQAQRRGRRGKLKREHRARRVRSRRGARGRVGCSCALRSERGVGGRHAMRECGLHGRRARRCRAPAARWVQRAQAHGDSGPALPLLQTPSITTRRGSQWSGCSVRRSPPHDMKEICTCCRTTAEPPSSTAQAPARPTRWHAAQIACIFGVHAPAQKAVRPQGLPQQVRPPRPRLPRRSRTRARRRARPAGGRHPASQPGALRSLSRPHVPDAWRALGRPRRHAGVCMVTFPSGMQVLWAARRSRFGSTALRQHACRSCAGAAMRCNRRYALDHCSRACMQCARASFSTGERRSAHVMVPGYHSACTQLLQELFCLRYHK